jgi:hypothetical protein
VRLQERAKKNNTLINNILILEIMYRLNQSHTDCNIERYIEAVIIRKTKGRANGYGAFVEMAEKALERIYSHLNNLQYHG